MVCIILDHKSLEQKFEKNIKQMKMKKRFLGSAYNFDCYISQIYRFQRKISCKRGSRGTTYAAISLRWSVN